MEAAAAAPDVDPVRGLASALATTVGRHGWTAVLVLLCILLFAPTVPLSLMLAWFMLWLTMNLMMMVTTRRLHLRLGGPFRMDPVHYRLMLMAQDRDFNENDYDALLALDDNTPTQRLRGASQASIEALRLSRIGHGTELGYQNCPICLEAFCLGDVVRTLPCVHFFHRDCVDVWLNVNNSCPVCKLKACF